MSVRLRRTGSALATDHNTLANRGTRTHPEIDSYLADIDNAKGISSSLTSRLDAICKRVIVFVIPEVTALGGQEPEISFPFNGTIDSVSASCILPSIDGDLVLNIEKCTRADYENTPVWRRILTGGVVIENFEKSSETGPDSVIDPTRKQVNAGDYFRVTVTEGGMSAEGVTIYLTIKI